jgi:hypothetical protein
MASLDGILRGGCQPPLFAYGNSLTKDAEDVGNFAHRIGETP